MAFRPLTWPTWKLFLDRKSLLLLFSVGQFFILAKIYTELNYEMRVTPQRSLVTRSGSVVPKRIHQTWANERIPRRTAEWVRKWRHLNPDWEYVFWTDNMARAFIAKKFPNYLDLYDQYSTNIHRVDIFRYFLLYEYGGVYADIDVEPLKPLDPVLTRGDLCILPLEPEEHYRLVFPHYGVRENNYSLTTNAIMLCRPKHPFFLYVIRHLKEMKARKNCDDPILTLECTGPMMLSLLRVKYLKSLTKSRRVPENHVATANAKMFMPTFDPEQKSNLRRICNSAEVAPGIRRLSRRGMELCDTLNRTDYRNVPADESVTVHHWMHSWTTDTQSSWSVSDRIPVDIRTVAKDVTLGDSLFTHS